MFKKRLLVLVLCDGQLPAETVLLCEGVAARLRCLLQSCAVQALYRSADCMHVPLLGLTNQPAAARQARQQYVAQPDVVPTCTARCEARIAGQRRGAAGLHSS
jgi:hypothetical protein